jgi:hypothetical protein
LTSTSHKFFAAQFFIPAGPIWAKHAGIKSALQRVFTTACWAKQQNLTQNKRSDFLKLSKFAALTALRLTKKANENRRLVSKNIGDRFGVILVSKIYEKTLKNL